MTQDFEWRDAFTHALEVYFELYPYPNSNGIGGTTREVAEEIATSISQKHPEKFFRGAVDFVLVLPHTLLPKREHGSQSADYQAISWAKMEADYIADHYM